MYTVHFRFIGKPVVNLLFVIIEYFSLTVTPEALRANIDWKLAFLRGRVSFGQSFTQQRTFRAIHFCTDRQVRQFLTTLSLTISTVKLVADFHQLKCKFRQETAVCVSKRPFNWGLRGNVRRSSQAYQKAQLNVFRHCYASGATNEYRLKIGLFARTGTVLPKSPFTSTRLSPTSFRVRKRGYTFCHMV